MKVLVFGANKKAAEKLLKKSGFSVVKRNPNFVVSYGGDGTLMRAEHAYPGIPKIILKDSVICKVCPPFSNEVVLEKIKAGRYTIEPLMKLEVSINGKKLTGLNDITVHNANPRHGIRYKIWAGKRQIGEVIIGDGVVVATPFGSTAYYRSITGSFFETGIGLAFNNSTEQLDHVVLGEKETIKIQITRGPAMVYADNQEEYFQISEGDTVTIRKSPKVARWVIVK